MASKKHANVDMARMLLLARSMPRHSGTYVANSKKHANVDMARILLVWHAHNMHYIACLPNCLCTMLHAHARPRGLSSVIALIYNVTRFP
jgi:hypothetical protein